MTPSKYQEAIYEWARKGTGNACVEAVAGSGKTATIEGLTKIVSGKVLFLAFNKSIVAEVQLECEVRTMNSFGHSLIPGWKKVNINKTKNILLYDVCDGDYKKCKSDLRAIPQIISLAKANAFMNLDNLDWILDRYGIELHNPDQLFATWALLEQNRKIIDFDDQIYLPVKNGFHCEEYDWIMIDEAQDLNPIMIQLLLRTPGRKIFVGDERQAIYGFRGADEKAMSNIRAAFDTVDLPLSICYRCDRAIIDLAKRIVPHIEARKGTEEGIVANKDFDPVDGDLVLCRVTAELVKSCMSLIKDRKKAMIKGRDIGANLLDFYKTIGDIDEYEHRIMNSKMSEDAKITISDKCETLRILSTFGDIENAIKEIFTDKLEGVIHSTIHKAKGLQYDRVWILRPDLLPHPRAEQDWEITQEENLHYVAITRAVHELYYVKETS